MIKKIWVISVLILSLCFNAVQADISEAEVIGISLINQNPDPARAGEMLELRFRVENFGGMGANNLEIGFIPGYPFLEVPGEEYLKTIKTLSAYQTGDEGVIIKYTFKVDKDAVKGVNEIKLKQGKAGSTAYAIRSFDIEITGKEFAQIIYVDKAKIDPGKETKLKFTITNIGNSPLQNIVFSWNEKNGIILPVYSDDTKYIKYIDVGGSTDLEYTVVADVNAAAGLYQLNLNLKFESEGGVPKEINTKAGVFVGGETDFDVTFSESSAGQTSLSVANTGNNPALSVTVRIPEQKNFRVTGSASSIIGNLDKGDYTIVSFQITQANSIAGTTGTAERAKRQLSDEERQRLSEQLSQRNASESNKLKVLIEYTDTTGVRQIVEKTVPIQFRLISTGGVQTARISAQTQSIWTKPIFYIPAILAIAAVIVTLGVVERKRKYKEVFFLKTLLKEALLKKRKR